MNEFEPYLYYIFVFVGIIFILGVLIFIAYQVTNKK